MFFRTEFGRISWRLKRPRRKLEIRPKFRPKNISDGFRTELSKTFQRISDGIKLKLPTNLRRN